MTLIEALKLPIDERGQRRAAARAEWFAAQDQPLEVPDVLDSLNGPWLFRSHCAWGPLWPPYGRRIWLVELAPWPTIEATRHPADRTPAADGAVGARRDRRVSDAGSNRLGRPRQAGQRGRLIFALDATMSRQPTWDTACQLQADMFREAAAIGGLDVQLVYYRGLRRMPRLALGLASPSGSAS